MTSPEVEPRGFRGMPQGGCLVAVLVAVAIVCVMTMRPAGILVAVFLLVAAALAHRLIRTGTGRLRVTVAPGGVMWTGAVTGPGLIVWQDLGALVVKEPHPGRGPAIYLVRKGGDDAPGLIVTAADLDESAGKGRERIRELAALLIRHIPPEVVIDRQSRRQLEEWKLDTPGRADE